LLIDKSVIIMGSSGHPAAEGGFRMSRTATIQVLGAIAYGEWKAYEGARRRAGETSDPAERKVWRTIAAEELRHHKGFVRRLEAAGGEPERAMARFRASLDHFHGLPEDEDPVARAVCDFLGEGIATDLLSWFRQVIDPETAAFVDTVLEDEVGHEGRAISELRRLIESEPNGRARAAAGARGMLVRMATSSPGSGPSFVAFLQIGNPLGLLSSLSGGYLRRLRAIGIGPLAPIDELNRLVRRQRAPRAA
jgi:hypothetical protein